MRTLIVLCHPNQNSFCATIAQRITDTLRSNTKTACDFIDLYREQFSPLLTQSEIDRRWSFDETVQQYIARVTSAQTIIIIHPDWWGGMPALLAGWIQRVWIGQVAFRYEGEEFETPLPRGLFSDKKLLTLVTTDSAEHALSAQSLRALWEHIRQFAGIGAYALQILYNFHDSSASQRGSWLKRVEQVAQRFVSA